MAAAALILAVLASSPSAPGGVSPSQLPRPLTLEEVLSSVRQTHPSLERAELGVERARAKQLAAAGAWDQQLQLRTQRIPIGYYDNTVLDSRVTQPTPLWGLDLYAGYRLGVGDFPVYKEQQQTNSGGELFAGLNLPLWKDRSIDAERAGIRQTEALTTAATCRQGEVTLKVEQQAAKAYWKWVADGRQVGIAAELLAVAQRRDEALKEQARLGKIAEIVVVDNTRLVLDRQSKWVEAQRDFSESAFQLSLFLRDEQKNAVVVPPDRLPAELPELEVHVLSPEANDLATAVAQRPELCRLDKERSAAEVQVELAANRVAPTLNALAFVSKDFGSGQESLEPAEFGVGVVFEMPLALRKARGDLQSARTEARAVDAEWRGTRDAIAAEVRQARFDLQAAAQQAQLAAQQLAAARRLAEAERDKLNEGASDLVVVNLRELAAADAARLEVKARAAYQVAWANYRTVIGEGL